jgi:hypothetical protein
VLLGPYSQFGWHHPGPLLFYTLAPLYFLSDYHEMGLRWAAILINLACLTGIAAIAWRRGDRLFGVTFVACVAVLFVRASGDLMYSAWNPHITLLPLALFVFLVADMCVARISVLPYVLVLGSFIVQSNIAYVPVVLAVGGVALLFAFNSSTPLRTSVRFRQLINRCLWALVIVWSGPIAEELVNTPSGNFDRLAGYLENAGPAEHSFEFLVRVVSHYFLGPLAQYVDLPRGWGVEERISSVEILAALALACLTGCLCWRERRTAQFTSRVGLLILVALATGVWSTHRVPGQLADHYVFWLSVFGSGALAYCLSGLVRAFSGTEWLTPRTFRVCVGAMLSVLFVLSVRGLYHWHGDAVQGRQLVFLQQEVASYLSRTGGGRPTIIRTPETWGDSIGLVLAFAKKGQDVRAADDLLLFVGEQYRVTDTGRNILLFDVNRNPLAKLLPGVNAIATRGRVGVAEVPQEVSADDLGRRLEVP